MTIRRAVCRRTEKKDNGGDILQIYLLETIEIDTSPENKAHAEEEEREKNNQRENCIFLSSGFLCSIDSAWSTET